MKYSFLLTIAVVLLLNGREGVAQKLEAESGEIRFGISAGFTSNQHINGFGYLYRWENCDCRYPVINADGEWGHAIGAVGEYNLDNDFQIAGRVLYARRPGSIPAPQYSNIHRPTEENGWSDAAVAEVENPRAIAVYNLIEIDLMAGAKPNGNRPIGVALGLAVGYTLRLEREIVADVVHYDPELVESAGLRTRDDGRQLVIEEGRSLDGTAPYRVSLRGGLFYDFPIFDYVTLTPGIYYDYGLTPVHINSQWTVNSFMFHLDITRGLYR